MKYAVLLMAYGGPDSLDDVQPYLLDVRNGRETPVHIVEEVRERYAQIGGKSPLLEITRTQAAALEEALNAESDSEVRVYVGMRHWTPYIQETVEQIYQDGFRRIIALCMAPYYSKMSVGAYREKLNAALAQLKTAGGSDDVDVQLIESWHDHPFFIRAIAEKIRAGLAKFPAEIRGGVQVVFTAHSLPAAIMQQGDPYADHHTETARLAAQAAGLGETCWQIGYQSAPMQANMRWLGPSLEEILEQLASEGIRQVLVAPVGFVADHVEILYDVDIEFQEEAGKLGLHLERTESMNASPLFIAALADLIRNAA